MLFAVAATIMGGIGNVAGAAIAAIILGIIQNASILVISSEWQGFLLYVFLFLAIVFFPEWFSPAEAAKQIRLRDARVTSGTRSSACRKSGVGAMEYLYSVIILVGLYVILATSFNLIIGYGGLVSIAHPVFFALGAYTSAILSRDFQVPVLLAMLRGLRGRSRCVDRTRAAVASCFRRLPADRQYRLPARTAGADQERPLHRRTGRLYQHPAVPDPRVRAARVTSFWCSPSCWRRSCWSGGSAAVITAAR